MFVDIVAGAVGGEKDGVAGRDDIPSEKMYTTSEDRFEIYRRMSAVDGTCMFSG